jgi:hypothetical protein
MTASDFIARARSQIGQSTAYGLGRGTTTGASPRDEIGACDCSAFVCWCLDIRKHQPSFAWLVKLNGGWYNTDGMWWDAGKERTGFFERIAGPRQGAIVVFPSRGLSKTTGPKIGHVGLVTRVGADGSYRVVHCSAGNFRSTGDAIQETASTMFTPPSTLFAWASPIA